MENIYDFGRVSYAPAEPVRTLTISETLSFLFHLVIDVVKVLLLIALHGFTAIGDWIVKPPKKSVSGQTVLVTGGGNGIGRALAFQFAREGCNIAIVDLDWEAAQKTVTELTDMKAVARAYQVDITNVDQIQKLKIDVEKDISPVDILVNNAGIVPMLSLREGTEKDVERIIQVNITAHVHMTRAFLPEMINHKRGHIVGIASMSAIHPVGGAVIYSATKGAMQNFTIALNEELRQEGNGHIKCTSVLPYIVATRKDIVENANFRFPIISSTYVAEIAVDAILRNQLMVTVPRSYLWLTALTDLLPFCVQMLIRDHILKEKGKRFLSEHNRRNK